ncbi:unnamed protein product [Protopolystoma xenopodis]|uniref:Uncharacterized protein n=1 Tax=Protopolystoma xenopodis TaxID=117903 RepID=A0A3S4ZS38_9PLAT|nr:unnamed protein product [Protopolystoma xenopodis]
MALSSSPPEPLPIPPGFGLLTTLGDMSTSCSTNSVLSKNLPSTGSDHSCRVPSTMVTGSGRFACTGKGETNSQSEVACLTLPAVASRLLPLLAHNRHVFGPYYAEIIQDLLHFNSSRPDATTSTI